MQPDDAGNGGEIAIPAATMLFRLFPFLALGAYKPILDMQLPELDGYTQVSCMRHPKKLHAHPWKAEIPVTLESGVGGAMRVADSSS